MNILTKLMFGSLISVGSTTFVIAGGDSEHSHDEKPQNDECTIEHAKLGHCKMETSSHNGHHHDHHHGDSHASAVGMPVEAEEVSQTVQVDMLDTMQFVFSDKFILKPGKTIKFVVTNKGKLRHEFSIGSSVEQEKHAKAMMANPDMKHADADSGVTVEPGETKSLTWTFLGNGEVVFACTLPGHYQAGMIHKQRIVNLPKGTH